MSNLDSKDSPVLQYFENDEVSYYARSLYRNDEELEIKFKFIIVPGGSSIPDN